MRVTSQVRENTRRKILQRAHLLFRMAGYEAATVRDLCKSVGIAAGTLFNYFPNKESLAAALVLNQSQHVATDVSNYRSLEEVVYAFSAQILRRWKPCRNYLMPVLQSTLTPAPTDSVPAVSWNVRSRHLDELQRLCSAFRSVPFSSLELNLYWNLFFGAVAFWVSDQSRNHEATLALLDESVSMFVSWVNHDSTRLVREEEGDSA